MQCLSNVGAAFKALIEGINNGVHLFFLSPCPGQLLRQRGPEESEASEERDVQVMCEEGGHPGSWPFILNEVISQIGTFE